MLVTGRDRKITEFNDPLFVPNGKVWLSGHDSEVLSACVKQPSLFVTTTVSGEIGFWELKTGQLIKKHEARMMSDNISKATRSNMSLSMGSMISSQSRNSITHKNRKNSVDDEMNSADKEKAPKTSMSTPKEHYEAVASLFLEARPEAMGLGTLLISTRNGVVQLWCTYKVPKYVAQFTAIHMNDDYVTAMATDLKNDYLLTSFNSGYMKTWHILNFGLPRNVIRPMSIQVLRLQFPFLLDSLFVGRAERAANKNLSGPLLVSSYRAHLQCIHHIEYIDEHELVVSNSEDKKIRIWTLSGHYVGTFGEFRNSYVFYPM